MNQLGCNPALLSTLIDDVRTTTGTHEITRDLIDHILVSNILSQRKGAKKKDY